MRQIFASALLTIACTLAVPGSGCSRRTPPGLHLSYAVDWSTAGGAPQTPQAKAQRLDALVGLHDEVLARLAAAGFADSAVQFDSGSSRFMVRVPGAKREDTERIVQLIAPPPALEHRLESTEPYIDDAFRAFLAADPDREDSVLVVTDAGERFVMARGRTPDEERALLVTTLQAWRQTPEVRGDATRAAVWARVRIGQAQEPKHVAIHSEVPEMRWRTYLVEPEVLLAAGQVAGAKRRLDPNGIPDRIWVVVDYTADGARRLADVTAADVGRTMVINVDDVVVFAGRITEPITGGSLRLGLGAGTIDDLGRRADEVVDALAACVAGVRLRQPPLEQQWTAP